MKKSVKLFFAAAILAAIVTGCADLPTVGFTFEPGEVTQYAEVTFTNTSTGADSYAWDFGDEYVSAKENPTHVFKSAGTFTVTLVASNADGDSETSQTIEVAEHVNAYTLDGTEFVIDSDIFWYQSSMGGGDPYLRLLTPVAGQESPDLLKLYPNIGLGELPGTYTWDVETPEGSYDLGYTADYAGMSYKWTSIGKTGSGDLVITDLGSDLYKFEAEMVLSVGSWDFSTGEFTETGTSNLSLDYVGGVTPL
ncbi:MAG: PKD domain-containing protein [Bacteroidota bacterium]